MTHPKRTLLPLLAFFLFGCGDIGYFGDATKKEPGDQNANGQPGSDSDPADSEPADSDPADSDSADPADPADDGGQPSEGTDTEPDDGTDGSSETGGDGTEPDNDGMLPQDGNPAHKKFDRYKNSVDKADNILSYQLDNGGWPKNVSYDSPGNGGDELGTFDNGATTMELTVMADAYNRTGDEKYLKAARKGIDFVLDAQYPEGGWPQFYPLRGKYSDHVTFNDDAMSRVLTLLHHAAIKTPPFDTDVLTDEQRARLQPAIDGGVDYILKAQIIQNGKKSVWCAQHGKSDYKPKRARAYEHPSLSGSESVEVIGFLMTQFQTPEVKEAVVAAVDWFRSSDTFLQDYAYENDEFIPRSGSRVWYRFYDISTNEPIFSNYDGKIHIGLDKQDKKKQGYRWAGTWGEEIIEYAESVGY
jgi:PelA/Pel-15E family pectate lyase